MKPKIIAHKGFSEYYKGNSWEAFKKALEVEADMCELDLVLTKDNKIFINHDYSIQGKLIAELSLEEAKKLFPESPNLEELLNWAIENKMGLLLEVKDRRVIEVLSEILSEFDASNFIIGSFDALFLKEFKKKNPHIRTSIMFGTVLGVDDMIRLTKKYECEFAHPCWEHRHPYPHELISKEDITKLNEEGIEVISWHEERPDELKELLKKGFYGITTNNPKLLKVLRDGEA